MAASEEVAGARRGAAARRVACRVTALVLACASMLACRERVTAATEQASQHAAVDVAAGHDVSPATPACTDWSRPEALDVPPVPASPYADLLDEVWRTVARKHFDRTLGCIDWAAIRMRYGAELARASDRASAYAILGDMLGELEQSHFTLFPPVDDEPVGGSASPKLTVRWLEDAFVVVESELANVPRGAVVLAIDGTPVGDLVARVRARARSGHAREAFELGRAASLALSCPLPGDVHTVRVAAPGRDEAPADVQVRCVVPEGELVSLGHLENVPTRVEHRMIASTRVGVLAFNIWMLPMVERARAALTDLREQGMRALVIDLRGNPGGVGPMSVPIARMLLDRKVSLGRLQFRDFVQEFNVEPDPDPFTGPVAVLVDEGTASTSEIFAAGLRDADRAVIVGGGPSAGAALPSLIEELEGGAVLQYVVGNYTSPRGTTIEGQGLLPDVVVMETRAAFAAGRDPVLDAAVERLTAELAANGETEDPK